MKSLGLVVHPEMPAAAEAAVEIAKLADKRGLIAAAAEGKDKPDVLIALGGDGTILRAARLANRGDIPLAAVNFGRLGFLSTVEPGNLTNIVDALANGEYRTDERMMLEADIIRDGQKVDSVPALNEVVLERGTLSRVVSIRVSVGSEPIATYIADGFIVSTPSGSTAYSLSAGGPVLEPQLEAMVLTAVSPHWPLWRSIVVGPNRPVTLFTPKDSVAFSADGATLRILEPGTSVVVAPSSRALKLISLKGLRFYDRLRFRFHQPEPDL